MTKKREKEEDVLEAKAYQKEMTEEITEIEKEKTEKAAPVKEKEEKKVVTEKEKGMKEEMEEKEKKMQEYLNGWKRCQADFENYKKRQAELQKEMARYAAEDVMFKFVPVLDNFYASIGHIPPEQKNSPWVTGIMHIQKQLEDVLRESGMEEINVKAGDDFDPRFHEAIKKEESSKKQEESEFKNKIIKVIQKGYKMGEKIIRPARVIVE